MPNFTRCPPRLRRRGRSTSSWNLANRAGRPPSARICSGEAPAPGQQVAGLPPGPRTGQQLGRQQRVGVEARLVARAMARAPGRKAVSGRGSSWRCMAPRLSSTHDQRSTKAAVAAGQVVEAPEAAGEGARVALAADDEVVGRGQGDVLGHAEIVGRGVDVLVPVEGADVEPVVDRGAAEDARGGRAGRPGAERRASGTAKATRCQRPSQSRRSRSWSWACSARSPMVGQGPEAVVGGVVDGALTGAAAHEEALADEAAQARAHLLGRALAGLGHRERVGGGDGAVVAGDAEDEHAGGQVADAHDSRWEASGRGTRPGPGSDRAAARSRSAGRFPHDRQSRRPVSPRVNACAGSADRSPACAGTAVCSTARPLGFEA